MIKKNITLIYDPKSGIRFHIKVNNLVSLLFTLLSITAQSKWIYFINKIHFITNFLKELNFYTNKLDKKTQQSYDKRR